MRKSISALLIICNSAPGFASSRSLSKAKDEVRARWKTCVQLRSTDKTKKVYFAEFSEEGNKGRKWKLVAKSETSDSPNEAAHLYFDSTNNLIYSRIGGGSPSGDHSYEVEYCFRPSGELAFILRTFKTTQGLPDGVREERRIWINEHQKKIDNEITVFDLKSGKPQKKEDQNYFRPESMGWKTLPDTPEKLTTKTFLSQFPNLKL